ncbi:hypothetical protein ACJRO7_025640 [Eucalyptus globulus]|uniref:RING-type E3 ubiquitin transferase n=1 Tax=Eucalyptus globulus TaxID=34317 RepID=A0ABD3KEZ1_EUCGL
MVLEISVHQREQREMQAAPRESIEQSSSRFWIMAMDGCVICKEEISRDEEVVCMPCKHMFHHECVVRWLNESNLCPLCRFQMPTRSGDL